MIRALKLETESDERSDSPEEIKLFEDRLQEFWDIVNMSFSSSHNDEQVQTYSASSKPELLNYPGFWCPIAEPQQDLLAWLDYSPPVREAFRRGFRRGIGILTDFYGSVTAENWFKYKSGLLEKMSPFLDIFQYQAEQSGQYLLGQKRIELLLNSIYAENKHIPYHPDFDRAFKNKLTHLSLHGIGPYIEQLCTQPYNREMLDNSEGHSYLHDLVTEVSEIYWLDHVTKTQRAYESLNYLDIAQKQSFNKNLFDNHLKIPEQEPDINESPWKDLLIGNMSVKGFFDFLQKCDLIDSECNLTLLGSGTGLGKSNKAPWAGSLKALVVAKLLTDNIALVCEVLKSDSGLIKISINPNTIRVLSKVADNKYLKKATEILKQL